MRFCVCEPHRRERTAITKIRRASERKSGGDQPNFPSAAFSCSPPRDARKILCENRSAKLFIDSVEFNWQATCHERRFACFSVIVVIDFQWISCESSGGCRVIPSGFSVLSIFFRMSNGVLLLSISFACHSAFVRSITLSTSSNTQSQIDCSLVNQIGCQLGELTVFPVFLFTFFRSWVGWKLFSTPH